jgi:ornithine decarboxylase
MAHFIIDKKIALQQYSKAKELADIVSYSSKTNPVISPILEENTDCLFSIHLENELVNVKDKSRVIFLAQGWTKEQIAKLVSLGITIFTVDNLVDLEIFEEYIKENEKQLTLFLRMKLKENTIRTEKHFVFGISSEIINKKIKYLHEKYNFLKLGIHFHRKTQNMSEWSLVYEISEHITEETFSCLSFVNMGGGLPSEYANTNQKVLAGIIRRINEFKQFINEKGIKLIIEPGRFIAAPAGKLITKIIRIYDNNIIVDASVYNSDMDALIVPVKLKVEGEYEKDSIKDNPDIKAYVIKGITPCSLDLFRYRVYLTPEQVTEGNQLVFLNAGAYNFSTDFCNLSKIETNLN